GRLGAPRRRIGRPSGRPTKEHAMTSRPSPAPGDRPVPTDDDVAWVASHLPEVRRRLAGNEILYWWIGGTVVLGLIANVAGFLWASIPSGTPDRLAAARRHTLGPALWTGARGGRVRVA